MEASFFVRMVGAREARDESNFKIRRRVDFPGARADQSLALFRMLDFPGARADTIRPRTPSAFLFVPILIDHSQITIKILVFSQV